MRGLFRPVRLRPALAALVLAITGSVAAAILAAKPAPTTALGASAAAATVRPQRIMSTNLCSDILLLMLVPKDRIVSITHLAHGPVSALLPGADDGVGINHGTAEEVVSQQPDLILASPWSTPVMRRLAREVGAPVVEVESANSFEDIRRITRQIGAAVGEPERAEAVIAGMDRKLAELERTRPARSLEVAAWSAGDVVPGAGTLTDEIIRVAGARNLASRLPAATYSTLGVEEVLAARPNVIMRGQDNYEGPALRDAVSEHPALREAFRGRRLTYPASLYSCGLPQSADAAGELRQALAKVPDGEVTW